MRNINSYSSGKKNFTSLHKKSSLTNDIQNVDEKIIKVYDNIQKYKFLCDLFKNTNTQNQNRHNNSINGKINSLSIDETALLNNNNSNLIRRSSRNSFSNGYLVDEIKSICKRIYNEENDNNYNNTKNNNSVYISELYPNYNSNKLELYKLGFKKNEKNIPYSMDKKNLNESKNLFLDGQNEQNRVMTDTMVNFDNNKYINFSHDYHTKRYEQNNNKYDYSRYAKRNEIIHHPQFCTLKKFKNIGAEALTNIREKKTKGDLKRNIELSELIPCKNTDSNLRQNFYMYLFKKEKFNKIFKVSGNDKKLQ